MTTAGERVDRTVWARVDDGFHVGSRAGDFVGYIDRRGAAEFYAFDMRSHLVGVFADLSSATRAFSAASETTTEAGL